MIHKKSKNMSIQNLPRGVVEDILNRLSLTDALNRPRKDKVIAVIEQCPEGWQSDLTSLFVVTFPDRGEDPVIYTIDAPKYLIPANVAHNISYKTKKRQKMKRMDIDKMCAWLLSEYGSTMHWRACQIHRLLEKPSDLAWSPDMIEKAFPSVLLKLSIDIVAFDLDGIAKRLSWLSEEVRVAILSGRATPGALMRTEKYLMDGGLGFKGNRDSAKVTTHVLQGDDIIAKLEWDEAVESFLGNVEDGARLRVKLERVPIIVGYERLQELDNAIGSYLVSSEFHDDIVSFLLRPREEVDVKFSENKLIMEALRDRVIDGHYETSMRMVRSGLQAMGINEDDEDEASEWLEYNGLYDFVKIDVPSRIYYIKRYVIVKTLFEENYVTVTTNDLDKGDVSLSDIIEDVDEILEPMRNYLTDVGFQTEFSSAEEMVNHYTCIFDRYEELKAALESRGLKIRQDSQLCREYIEDDEGDVYDIVDVMIEMNFFVNLTDYQDIVKGIRDRRGHHERNRVQESEWAKQVAILRVMREGRDLPGGIKFSFPIDEDKLDDAFTSYDELMETDVCNRRSMCAYCMNGFSSDEYDDDRV
jgi:hypothetical protein